MLPRGSLTPVRFSRALVILAILSVIAYRILNRRNVNNLQSANYARTLYDCLLISGFVPDTARLIVAQAAHESNNFTSKVFRHNFNPFGMRRAFIRPTTAESENFGYAVYGALDLAAQDYRLWYVYNDLPETFAGVADFVKALKANRYFEDTTENYTAGVMRWYNRIWG